MRPSILVRHTERRSLLFVNCVWCTRHPPQRTGQPQGLHPTGRWCCMKYDPHKHHRRSIRLKDYDYSQQGAYFVTICVHERRCLFGTIDHGEMQLNASGTMVANAWLDLNNRFPTVKTDVCVVMPNHIHGIIWIGQPQRSSLGHVIGAFKSITTDQYIDGVRKRGWTPFSGRVWQRNYYEHIIRNDRVLHAIRNYMEANPSRWADDPENPVCSK